MNATIKLQKISQNTINVLADGKVIGYVGVIQIGKTRKYIPVKVNEDGSQEQIGFAYAHTTRKAAVDRVVSAA